MSERLRENMILAALLLFATFVFTVGITWGLPSRKVDPFLFGDRKPWTGAEIVALAPQHNGSAADVDVNPATRGSVVNDTDAKRAEIVRRFRLFTYQPDEMITMMSLAQMHPSAGDFDPRLYQYGGLWIYPVGALIKLLLHPVADQAYYLDHPEQFAQFYVVARAYSAAWGVVGAWAVYRLVRGCASRFATILATLLYITMPVVVNMAHEAKPHLPAAALTLLAALAARNYIARGGWRRLMLMAALCGAAAGMILSATIAIVIAMLAVILRARASYTLSPVPGGEGRGEGPALAGTHRGFVVPPGRPPHPNPLPRVRGRGDQIKATVAQMMASIVLAAIVYFATNPYVLKHLLTDRSVLSANLGNSRAMYRPNPVGGVWRAVELTADGASLPVLLGGVVGGAFLLTRRLRSPANVLGFVEQAGALLPISAHAAVVGVGFALLAAGKPGEYGRFGLSLDIALALLAAVALASSKRRIVRWTFAIILVAGNGFISWGYLDGFWHDAKLNTGRLALASALSGNEGLNASLGLYDEPAPYLMPPIDLWRWKLVLLHRDDSLHDAFDQADLVLRPGDTADVVPLLDSVGVLNAVIAETEPTRFAPTPISWADKWIQIWGRMYLASQNPAKSSR